MPVVGPAAALAGGGWVKAPFETTARYRFALWASLCARLAALNFSMKNEFERRRPERRPPRGVGDRVEAKTLLWLRSSFTRRGIIAGTDGPLRPLVCERRVMKLPRSGWAAPATV